MESANQKLLEFLKDNPNSNKTAITEATGLNGLFLFNLLKKMQAEGEIIEGEEAGQKLYSMISDNAEQQPDEVAAASEKTESLPSNDEDQSEADVISKGRDNSKFKFNGEEYGKGPLVRAVVAQYVADNPTVTYDQLKELFPDELLKRFGIFQNLETATQIANKGNRYFTKPEQIIELVDEKIVVCNQFTLAKIQPFLKVAKKLGYKIK
ncbi:MAG: hypothetical protein EOO89_00110 [Pedobacter sp.]|nr:MAG: hypothetical protein EOO89_00110 [Pedobacter sp.]